MNDAERAQRLANLMRELETLKKSLPAHSVKPAMLMRIEELEEEVDALRREDAVPERRNLSTSEPS